MSCRCDGEDCKLTQHQATMHECTVCGKLWSARIYADDCAEQDYIESATRDHGNRG